MIKEGQCDNGITSQEQSTFEPVGLAVSNQVVDNQNTGEQDDSFKDLKEECHWDINGPASQDEHRGDQKANLEGRRDGNTDTQVHLVLHGKCDGADMFSSTDVGKCLVYNHYRILYQRGRLTFRQWAR